MDAYEIFFFFCKRERIMDIICKLIHLNLHMFKEYDINTKNFIAIDLRTLMNKHAFRNGFDGLFNLIECYDDETLRLTRNKRYIDAKKKWYRFIKNNIVLSNKFLKSGDEIMFGCIDPQSFFRGKPVLRYSEKYTVVDVESKKFGIIKITNHETLRVIPSFSDKIKVNNEDVMPKYCIKINRKIYGADK